MSNDDKVDTKIKSLHGGPVDIIVANMVKSPHEYVLSAVDQKEVNLI